MNYRLGKGYKNIKRYKEIAEVLVKYGFGFFVKKLQEYNLVPSYILKKKRESMALTTGERIRYICEELGPTFIKLGQMASTRSDLLSDQIVKELSKLQDNVKEVPFDSIKSVLEEELGISLEDAFIKFDENPIAAASIGQVHMAKLFSGEEVIVKIQRPAIKKVIETDISILLSMSRLFDEHFGYMIPFSLSEVMEELTTSIRHELDYTKEARNTERFRENFKNHDNVYIPKVYWNFTTKKVLIQEWIDGIKVSSNDKLLEKGWDTKKIANIGARAFLKQVFIDGFFHGDPHPGNILVIDENKISFIDFGLCGYLDKTTVSMITNMFVAGAKRDVEKIVDLLMQFDAITEETNLTRLKEDLLFLISHYYNTPLKKINMSEIVSEFMHITYDNKIRLPTQFAVLIKAMITVEGTGRVLYPEFSISAIMREFTGEVFKHRYNLKNILYNAGDFTEELFYDLKAFPKQLRTIIKMLEKNQIKITLDEIKFKKLEREINRTSNKLSLSIIISAIIVGSSLALDTDVGPTIFNLPLFSFAGYVISVIIGMVLIVSIILENFKK